MIYRKQSFLDRVFEWLGAIHDFAWGRVIQTTKGLRKINLHFESSGESYVILRCIRLSRMLLMKIPGFLQDLSNAQEKCHMNKDWRKSWIGFELRKTISGNTLDPYSSQALRYSMFIVKRLATCVSQKL